LRGTIPRQDGNNLQKSRYKLSLLPSLSDAYRR